MAQLLTITFFGGLGMFVFALLMVGLYSLLKESKTIPIMLATFSILLAFGSILAYRNVPDANKQNSNAPVQSNTSVSEPAQMKELSMNDSDAEISISASEDIVEPSPEDISRDTQIETVPNDLPAKLDNDITPDTPSAASPEYGFNMYDNPEQHDTTAQYVLNTYSMIFHIPECRDVEKIKSDNYQESNDSKESLMEQGFKPCGHCNP